jgi:hypothetical protein
LSPWICWSLSKASNKCVTWISFILFSYISKPINFFPTYPVFSGIYKNFFLKHLQWSDSHCHFSLSFYGIIMFIDDHIFKRFTMFRDTDDFTDWSFVVTIFP